MTNITVWMPEKDASLRNKMLEIAGRLDVERKSAENSEPEHKAPADDSKDKYRQPFFLKRMIFYEIRTAFRYLQQTEYS